MQNKNCKKYSRTAEKEKNNNNLITELLEESKQIGGDLKHL